MENKNSKLGQEISIGGKVIYHDFNRDILLIINDKERYDRAKIKTAEVNYWSDNSGGWSLEIVVTNMDNSVNTYTLEDIYDLTLHYNALGELGLALIMLF